MHSLQRNRCAALIQQLLLAVACLSRTSRALAVSSLAAKAGRVDQAEAAQGNATWHFVRHLKKMLNIPDRGATTTQKPNYHGLPLFYEEIWPKDWKNMSNKSHMDFLYRGQRWEDQMITVRRTGRCEEPRPDEKVIYFIEHGDGAPKKERSDSRLWELGVEQARNLQRDPMMRKALYGGPGERIEVVLTSPAIRCMETAIEGIKRALPNISIEVDINLKGMGVEGIYNKDRAVTMLNKLKQPELLKRYLDLPDDWHYLNSGGGHADRWWALLDTLKKRPEKVIALVTHHMVIKQAMLATHSAEARIEGFSKDGKLREISPPDCWGHTM